MTETISWITGAGGLLSPVLGSAWFVFSMMAVTFGIGYWLGRRVSK